MNTIGEAIQRVQSMYSRGVQSKDSRLTSRHIYSAILSARSTLLSQMSAKGQKIGNWAYQLLPCVELVKAQVHECPCIPAVGCSILRTREKIPKPITDLEKHMIKFVSDVYGDMRFDEDSFENTKYSVGNKYTANKPSYFPHNGYLFITVRKELKAITISMLANDPIEVYAFPSICDECPPCLDYMALEFPIDGDMLVPLTQLANQELIIMLKQMGEDRNANAADDTDTSKMIHQPNNQ